MNRWFLAAYLAYQLSRNFVNDWTLKIHFFKVYIYDIETSGDFYSNWSCTFRFQISFPRPELIVDTRKGYDFLRRIRYETKLNIPRVIRVWLWGKDDYPEN
ncbi:hypothetical protein BDGGKGIB_03836 [Nodularia sphaerocarpa UHCC 0038]|nr:hypothetical protein BDGGKGIB_03836 [Nodularia sphaerocarpa UHCC 0038]